MLNKCYCYIFSVGCINHIVHMFWIFCLINFVSFCRSDDCDVRIQLPDVLKEHCKLVVENEGEVGGDSYFSLNPCYSYFLNYIWRSNLQFVQFVYCISCPLNGWFLFDKYSKLICKYSIWVKLTLQLKSDVISYVYTS